MPIPKLALLLAFLMAGGPASATSSRLAELEAVGKAIFAKDRAASLATDRLLESDEGLPEDLRGWVTLPSGEGWRVFFVQEKGDGFCSRLSVLVDEDGAGSLRRSETCEPLTADQHAMFLARQTAVSALRTPCSEVYNTVVLPNDGAEAAWTVYLLAATQEPEKIVVGGHVRVLVREGGTQIVDSQELSRSCLTLAPPPDAVALIVTHVLDEHPIETHVFLSLLHQTKLYVVTETAMWSVDQGEIELLMDGEEFKTYLEKTRAADDRDLPPGIPARAPEGE